MTDPTVCAVMLTRDRPEMARRAVECFRAQTYANKRLLVWDNGDTKMDLPPTDPGWFIHCTPDHRESIGEMRNRANDEAANWWFKHTGLDIFIHFDSDDWSHPNRIAEQVALLQSTDADCVGYREMLFYDDRRCPICFDHQTCTCGRGNAWLYADAYRPVGTSLCYWRRTWERHPFPDLPQPRRQPNPDVRGEDVEWLRGLNTVAESSIQLRSREDCPQVGFWQPRMIARIHSGNSSGSYAELGKSVWWRRVPAWDAYCQARMTL